MKCEVEVNVVIVKYVGQVNVVVEVSVVVTVGKSIVVVVQELKWKVAGRVKMQGWWRCGQYCKVKRGWH